LVWGAFPQTIICIAARYFCPTEVETLLGNRSNAKQKIVWMPEITLQQVSAEMSGNDLAQAKQTALPIKHA